MSLGSILHRRTKLEANVETSYDILLKNKFVWDWSYLATVVLGILTQHQQNQFVAPACPPFVFTNVCGSRISVFDGIATGT